MNSWWLDVRYGLRALQQRPAFAVAAALTLGLGLGANIAIFGLVNAVLLRPPPVAEPERLHWVFTGPAERPYGSSSHPDYLDYRDAVAAFEALAAYGRTTLSLSADGGAEAVEAAVVSGNYFQVLGVGAAHGRVLTPDDDVTPGAHPVAVIGDGLWRRRFGADPGVVDRELRLGGQVFRVVGVTPPGFRGPEILERNEVWVPLAMQAVTRPPRAGFSGEMDPDLLQRRGSRWLQVLGRLAPGAPPEQAEQQLRVVSARLAEAHPDTNRDRGATSFPLEHVHPLAWPVLLTVSALLLAASGLVLLVVCANVAGLLVTRALARRREIAVRLALGASRARLVRQLLVEGLLLAAAGGLLGLLVARWTVDALLRSAPQVGIFSFVLDAPLDTRVAGFAASLALLALLLFALVPALQATRTDLVPALRDEGIGLAGGRRRGLREGLVVAQVALALVLLVGAGLFLRSAARAQSLDLGFDADRVLLAPLEVDLLRYTSDQGRHFYAAVLERMGALPGVEAASLARIVPVSGGSRLSSLEIDGRAPPPDSVPPDVASNVVSRGYFETMGIPVRRGRGFDATDLPGGLPVAVVNESFVRSHLGGGPAIGERIRLDSDGEFQQIVGVVADSTYRRPGEEPTPHVYQPLEQNHESGVVLHVRTAGDPASLAPAVREAVWDLEPHLPLSGMGPLSEPLASALFPARMAARLFSAMGVLALLLAALGTYAVVSQLVARRTREIGIRLALGARAADVARLVLGQGMRLVAVGLGIGTAAAIVLGRLVEGFLLGISGVDPWVLSAGPALVAGVALLACWVPARRALRLEPALALRHE